VKDTTFERKARNARRDFLERFFFAAFAGFAFPRFVRGISPRHDSLIHGESVTATKAIASSCVDLYTGATA
jgi:hypothetical protein